MSTKRDRILTVLRRIGPMTANDLMHATGISESALRRYLKPPAVMVHRVEWGNRHWVKYYAVTRVFCECGQPARWRLGVVMGSADGKLTTQSLELCEDCAQLVDGRERANLRPIV